jgi:hypothetical protein
MVGGAQKVLNPNDFFAALELRCPKGYFRVFCDDPEVRENTRIRVNNFVDTLKAKN